jgi:hypothetical protein
MGAIVRESPPVFAAAFPLQALSTTDDSSNKIRVAKTVRWDLRIIVSGSNYFLFIQLGNSTRFVVIIGSITCDL